MGHTNKVDTMSLSITEIGYTNLQESITISQETRMLLAHVVIIAAGHCGKHYWTNSDTRKIATGKLYFFDFNF